MYKLTLLIFLSILSSISIFSQEFNTKDLLCDTCNRELYLKFENTSFLKNNEYFNEFTEGFTGIGFFLKPTIEYYLTESTKINTGIYLLKYSGINTFSQTIPIFTIQQKLHKNLNLVFGNLYGTLNHKIEEPLYRFDNYYQNNVEYGLQFLYNSSNIESDLWINWEKFIFRNDPFQEEFEAGSISNFNILSSNKFGIDIPLQMLIYHKGGQIDSSPLQVLSLFNGMSGLKFKYNINKTKSLSFEPLFFSYQGLAFPEVGKNYQIFKKGKALYLNLKYRSKYLNSTFGYWSSEKFIAPKGEYLFLSVSELDNTYSQANREIITAKLEIKHNVSESVKIIFRTNGYLDLINKDLAYSYGLYLLINESFFVSKIKTKNQVLTQIK